MRSKFFIIYNGKMNTEMNVTVRQRPDMPTPQREYETIKVEGMDGELYEDKETYEDIQVEVEFNFRAEPEEWQSRFRKIKGWLHGDEDHRLIMSDDMEYFYNVKKVEIADTERVIKRIGRFKATFTCEPYAYKKSGTEIIDLESILVNEYEKTYPVYYIYGKGKIALTVNGNTVNADVDNRITIDTKLGLCYTETDIMENTVLMGDYDDIILQKGTNTFKYTKGFEVRIKPNWRSL